MFDDFVLFSSENPPDSSPAFPAEIIHKVTLATGTVWHYKIFTMPFAFACCTCFAVFYHLKFLSYKFERYLDSYPPFIMKIRSIYRMKEKNKNKKTVGCSFQPFFQLYNIFLLFTYDLFRELPRLIEVGASCFFDSGYCHTANWQFSKNLRKRLRSARSRPTILLFFMLPLSAYLLF